MQRKQNKKKQPMNMMSLSHKNGNQKIIEQKKDSK